MKLILWVQRSSSVDIGEQKVYGHCLALEQIKDSKDEFFIRIKYVFSTTDSVLKEHAWNVKDIIKMELIP